MSPQVFSGPLSFTYELVDPVNPKEVVGSPAAPLHAVRRLDDDFSAVKGSECTIADVPTEGREH